MSKPRISLTVECDTLAHAQTIAAALNARLSTMNRFDACVAFVGSSSRGNPTLTLEGRLNLLAQRDDLVTWLRANVKNSVSVGPMIISWKLTQHECSHDDPTVVNCRTTGYVEITG